MCKSTLSLDNTLQPWIRLPTMVLCLYTRIQSIREHLLPPPSIISLWPRFKGPTMQFNWSSFDSPIPSLTNHINQSNQIKPISRSHHRLVRRSGGQHVLRPWGPSAPPDGLRVARQCVGKCSRADVAQSSFRAIGAHRHKILLARSRRHVCGKHLPST